MPRRRDGDNKVIKETDDIISLFTFIDENKLQDVAKIRSWQSRCHATNQII